jgi:hypothetical protein
MCPLCLSTLIVTAVGTVSAGGVTALALKQFRAKRTRRPVGIVKENRS